MDSESLKGAVWVHRLLGLLLETVPRPFGRPAECAHESLAEAAVRLRPDRLKLGLGNGVA